MNLILPAPSRLERMIMFVETFAMILAIVFQRNGFNETASHTVGI